jgi:hypothetical protein
LSCLFTLLKPPKTFVQNFSAKTKPPLGNHSVERERERQKNRDTYSVTHHLSTQERKKHQIPNALTFVCR